MIIEPKKMKQKKPKHGHNMISPIICLFSFKIVDERSVFLHFLNDCRAFWLGKIFIVGSTPTKVHLRSGQSERCLVYSNYL